MAKVLSDDRVSSEEGRHDRLNVRPIAGGEDWSVSEFICAAGPGDRPFEELHEGYTIAAVVKGSFTYRGDSGVALMHPGALLLGNSGKCFECAHEHGAGDRCVSFNFSPELFCEIAITVRNQSPFAHTFYFGYANGWLGYLPTRRGFEEGGYEPKTSPFTGQAEQDLLTSVLTYVQGITR